MEIKPFKMRVTPEQSMIVQQTLFNNGYKKYYGDEIYIPKEPKTFIYLNKDINFTANNSDENYFTYNYLPELTFQEFFDRYVKWCVKVTDENYNTLEHWVMNRIDFDTSHVPIQCYIISDKLDGSYQKWTNYVPEGYIELTFEQFEKYVLKTKDMEKKIIGYKLKEDCKQYRVAACRIADISDDGLMIEVTRKGCSFLANTRTETYLKEAGVLDLWFEPVYEESSKELYFGKVKFTIKKGDNFATTEYGKVTKEDIEDAISWVENPPKLAGNTLSIHYNSTYCKITELDNNGTLSYGFGCQEGSLKELKTIYNAFK